MNTQTHNKLTLDEVKAIQDLRRIALRHFHNGGFDAVEKAYMNPMFTYVNSALTKLENSL